MAKWILLNSVTVGTHFYFAGKTVDDAVQSLSPIQAAGGTFFPATDATVAAAAAVALATYKKRGQAVAAILDSLMLASAAQSLSASGSSGLAALTATVVALTATVTALAAQVTTDEATAAALAATVAALTTAVTPTTAATVTHAMSPYVARFSDVLIPVDVSGGVVTVKFEVSPVTGAFEHTVKNEAGDASVNVITVDGNGKNVEDPNAPGTFAATVPVKVTGAAVAWRFNGTRWDLV